MAYQVFRNGFKVTSNSAIDQRIYLTKEEMLTAEDDYYLPDVYFAICVDDGKLYLYDVDREMDPQTGKYRPIEESIDFNDLVLKSKLEIALANSNIIQGIDSNITNIEGNIQLIMSESPIIKGYYLNNKFYTDSTYQVELEKNPRKLYIDQNAGGKGWYIYNADLDQYEQALRVADSEHAGIMKLYDSHGEQIDGTMTQRAITDSISGIEFDIAKVDSNGDGQLTDDDENCLILRKPW